MSINIVRYQLAGAVQWGVLREGGITPVPGEFATTGAFVQANPPESLESLTGETVALDTVELLSPLTRNQQFVCQGANYRQHMIESGVDPDVKTFNMIFTKAQSCICPADADVVLPSHVRFLDYEIELGLIIRRAMHEHVQVTDANLHEYVAGAVIVNDYSARDVQIPQMQFYKGKSYRSFGPVGPYLTLLSPAEIPALMNLRLTLTVNGEVRQQDNTRNMVYKPAETLTELSGVQDFEPGDLLSTGTPAGCALTIPSPAKQRIAALLPVSLRWKKFFEAQAKRPQYLKVGDVVESRIHSEDGAIDLGCQRNTVVAGT